MQPSVALIAGFVTVVVLGVPWLIALNDVLQRADSEFPSRLPGSNDRVIWVLVVLLGNIIGSIAYYFMVMGPYPRRPR